MTELNRVLSLSINSGDIFLHFHNEQCVHMNLWNSWYKRFQRLIISHDRAVSIAAKALRRGWIVNDISESGIHKRIRMEV